MHDIDIKHSDFHRIDLNLLVALDALLTECHVARAAERIFIGQPAMSHALARLRVLFMSGYTDDMLASYGVLGGETQAAWKMVGGNFSRAKTVLVDDWR